MFASLIGANIATIPFAVALPGLLSLAIIVELRTNKIPNWLVGVGLLAAVVLTIFDGMIATHVLGFVLSFSVALVAFVLGMVGGGYAKLLGAVGAIVGPIGAITAILTFFTFFILAATIPKPAGDDDKATGIKGTFVVSFGALVAAAVLFFAKYMAAASVDLS